MAVTFQTLDAFIGVKKNKKWSAELIERTNSREKNDTRIAGIGFCAGFKYI